MRELSQIGEHYRRVGAEIILVTEFAQRFRHVAAHQRLEQIDHARAVREAEHLTDVLGTHAAGRVRNRLIHQRERVTDRAFGGARDQAQRFRFG